MEKLNIKVESINEEIKFNVPLITKEELRYIDYNYNNLVKKYLSEYKSQRDYLLTQRLIYNLERENKKLKKQNKFLMKRENKLQILEMRKKEFIKYLEDKINKTDYEVKALGNNLYLAWSNAYKEILQKYKQIIGADNSD